MSIPWGHITHYDVQLQLRYSVFSCLVISWLSIIIYFSTNVYFLLLIILPSLRVSSLVLLYFISSTAPFSANVESCHGRSYFTQFRVSISIIWDGGQHLRRHGWVDDGLGFDVFSNFSIERHEFWKQYSTVIVSWCFLEICKHNLTFCSILH